MLRRMVPGRYERPVRARKDAVRLRRTRASIRSTPKQQPAVDALGAALAEQLRGALVTTGWRHGDDTADNVLADDDGRVVAAVDWCDGRSDGFAVLDVVTFLLTSESVARGAELGAVVLDRLADDQHPDGDLLARAQCNLGGSVLPGRTLFLLAGCCTSPTICRSRRRSRPTRCGCGATSWPCARGPAQLTRHPASSPRCGTPRTGSGRAPTSPSTSLAASTPVMAARSMSPHR